MPHPPPRKLLYPPTRRDKVVDDYHGTPVADPYRWLEAPQTPERHAWLEAQQRLTSAFLAAIPTRDRLKRDSPSCGTPHAILCHPAPEPVLFLA